MTELNQMQCGICAGCVPQVDGGSGFTNCADAHAAETAGDKMQYTKEQLIERASGEIECAKITLRNGSRAAMLQGGCDAE
ncbi:hypothetical protein N0P44_001591 [Citrobacter freundii]|nr:hypothetical protein [Citrobacter freundii]